MENHVIQGITVVFNSTKSNSFLKENIFVCKPPTPKFSREKNNGGVKKRCSMNTIRITNWHSALLKSQKGYEHDFAKDSQKKNYVVVLQSWNVKKKCGLKRIKSVFW